MNHLSASSGSLSFSFLGVPTVIRPSSWLVLLALGSGFNARFDLSEALAFVIAGMLCLLVHEYGHALSCRALGGGPSTVEIASLGGVTKFSYPPRTRLGYILMTLAGPGASLALGILGGVVLGLHIGVEPMRGMAFSLLFPLPNDLLPDELALWCYQPVIQALREGIISGFALTCYSTLFIVCVWWSIFNLLPIFPMDGGKTLYLIIKDQRMTSYVGLTVCVLLSVWCIVQGRVFTLIIFGWLMWINWQFIRLSR